MSAISILVFAFLIPIIPVSHYDVCNTSQGTCERIFVNASLFTILTCYMNCWGNVYTITLLSSNLTPGTASSPQMRGTAQLGLFIDNPSSSATKITSVTLIPYDGNFESSSASYTIFQCSSSNNCEAIGNGSSSSSLSITVKPKANMFNTATTAFYFSSAIVAGQDYECVLNFANGQSVTWVLKATATNL
jgi:hypothetical protein